MPEISRARQRARQRAQDRQARKYRPTGYAARRILAAALGVFLAGAAIGTTAGLWLGGGSQAPDGAGRSGPDAPSGASGSPPAKPPRADDARAKVPTSGYAGSPDPAAPAPDVAPAGGRVLSQVLDLTDRIVAAGRRRADAARPSAAAAPPAWQRNAAAYPEPPPGAARIAVVIDDVGLNRPNARQLLRLPGPLTLAFMTYAPDPAELTRAARAAGHELLVHVPMQPSDAQTDPGPKALRGDLAPHDLMARLDWALSRFEGYVGINNHMGSAFTRDGEGMRAVLGELKRRGLLFLDSRTTAETLAGSLAAEMDVVHASRDVFLDNRREVAAIRAQLEKTERIAREAGSAVAIGHPYDATIQALSAWLPTLRDKNVALVPISALATGRGPDVAQLPRAGE